MSIKKTLALIRAVQMAGFKIVDSRYSPTDDGGCWEATLAKGRERLVRVHNGGYGGPNQTFYIDTPEKSRTAISETLVSLFTVPEVREAIYDFRIEVENYILSSAGATQIQVEARHAELRAEAIVVDEDTVGTVVEKLASGLDLLKAIKRDLKKYFCCVLNGQDAAMTYQTYKAADTPATRASIQKANEVDYFLADLVDGL